MVEYKYPWWYGGCGGLVACMVTHPLDLIKVRLQNQRQRSGVVHLVRRIYAHESLFGFYSGLTAALLRQCTYTTARFGCYDVLKAKLVPAHEQTNVMYLLPCSIASGLVGGLVGNPADVVNIRMQNDFTHPPELRRNYRNALDGVWRIAKTEGVRKLFVGLEPNLVRGMLMTASQVVTYDKAKNFLLQSQPQWFDPASIVTHFTASLMAGFVATTVCSPADVLKTRLMNMHATHNHSVWHVLQRDLANEGPGFLFKGWTPSFVRLAPFTILIFLTVEQLKKHKVGATRVE